MDSDIPARIGDLMTANGALSMTGRTRAKIDENLELLVADIKGIANVSWAIESHEEQSLRRILYEALAWTADDVVAQAITDGYQPKEQGVL